MDKEKKYLILEIIFVFIFSLVVGNLTFVNPFYGDINLIDEGQFGAWANHMLLGKQMYKDIYITYGPLLVYPLYLLFNIFSPSAFFVRIYFTFTVVFGIFFVDLLLYKIKISKYTRWLILVFITILPVIQLRQAMGFLVIYLIIKSFEEKKLLWSFLTGVSIICAVLISPEIGIFSLFFVGLVFIYHLITSEKILPIFKKIIYFSLGLLIASLAFALYSISQGWFRLYLEVTYDVLLLFSGINLPNGQNFPNLLTLLPANVGLIEIIKFIFSKEVLLYWLIFAYLSALFYFFVKLILKIFNKNDSNLFLILLYGFLLYTILIGRSGIGHFLFVLSPFLILIFFFLERLFLIFFNSRYKIERIISLSLIILISIFLFRIVIIFRPHFVNITIIPKVLISAKDNPKRVGPVYISSLQKKNIDIIQKYVDKNVSEKENVFFFGDEPMMYLFINKKNPTRYDLPFIANTKEKRLEILNSFVREPPKYIIEDQSVWSVDGVSNSKRLPEVVSFIKINYEKTYLNKYIIVHKLKKI